MVDHTPPPWACECCLSPPPQHLALPVLLVLATLMGVLLGLIVASVCHFLDYEKGEYFLMHVIFHPCLLPPVALQHNSPHESSIYVCLNGFWDFMFSFKGLFAHPCASTIVSQLFK